MELFGLSRSSIGNRLAILTHLKFLNCDNIPLSNVHGMLEKVLLCSSRPLPVSPRRPAYLTKTWSPSLARSMGSQFSRWTTRRRNPPTESVLSFTRSPASKNGTRPILRQDLMLDDLGHHQKFDNITTDMLFSALQSSGLLGKDQPIWGNVGLNNVRDRSRVSPDTGGLVTT